MILNYTAFEMLKCGSLTFFFFFFTFVLRKNTNFAHRNQGYKVERNKE